MAARFDYLQSTQIPPVPRGPEDELFAKEANREIGDCLEAAPDRQRMAFVLREIEGLSTREICKVLEVSTQDWSDAVSRPQPAPGVSGKQVGASLMAMLSCQEVSRSIASDNLNTAGWRRRLSVKLHLLMCRHCRRYSRQIEAIGDATRRLLSKDRLEAGSRERLRSTILDQIRPPARDDESTPQV